MLKRLVFVSLVLFFLFGLVVTAYEGGAIKKPVEKIGLLEKSSYLHPKIESITYPADDVEIVDEKKSADSNLDSRVLTSIEDDVIPIPADMIKKPALEKKRGYLYPGKSEIVPFTQEGDGNPHGWLFNYDDDGTEYYLSGGTAGDEWGIWFQSPQAACSLYAVEFQFYAPEGGGTINLDVMAAGSVTPDTVANEDSIAVDAVFGDNLMGEGEYFPLEIEATSDWERFVFPEWGYDIDVGRDIFWIHWEKTGTSPMLLADDGNPGNYLHTWSYEPVEDGDWKWSHYGWDVGIEAMVRCEVIFYEDPPPVVQGKQMNDTYRTDAITLTASATDNALEPALEGIASGILIYSLNDGDPDTLSATVTGPDEDGVYTLAADVPAGTPGDVYEYYFGATDLAGLYSRSFPALSFERTEPVNPDADLLLVRDNVSSDQRDLFERVLDENDFVYELWDVNVRHGIDGSVINHGWSNIFVYGWGSKTVPVVSEEADPGYGTFIDNGGNLFLVDMDWFYGHGLPAAPTFEAGDFAYDYFGLASGTNDPGAIEEVDVTGLNVTEIDIPFVSTPLKLNHGAYLLTSGMGWIDYIVSESATDIFKDDADNIVGATMDHSSTGGGKAVYLSFMADAAGDTLEGGTWDYSQFATLLNGAIEYFGVVSPPIVSLIGKGTTRFGVASGTDGATINAEAFDGDGSVENVVVKWSVDEGTPYSQNMVFVEGIKYTADITLTDFTDNSTVVFWVEATDNEGLTTSSDVGSFWGTDFTPTEGVKVLYMLDYYGPNIDYGPSLADSIMKANISNAEMVYDYWDVWNNYQADYATVLSNYDAVIYAGVYDWVMNPEESSVHPLAEFVDNGGYLLYSSEEVLGEYTDWEDLSFGQGHFVYDVLGVEWVGNDYNYVGVVTYDDGGTGLITGLSEETIVLADTIDYFGSMADLCDPVGYGTEEMLPSPFLADYTGAGDLYYASSINGNVIFMAFNVSMMPTDQQRIFFDNFAEWAGVKVGIEDEAKVLPKVFALSQNYPNPFNPTTNIEFAVPEVSNVKIVVYNMLGQRIVDLANKVYQPGYYQVIWNGKDASGCDVSSGIYFYRMTAGDFTKTSKMVYLK